MPRVRRGGGRAGGRGAATGRGRRGAANKSAASAPAPAASAGGGGLDFLSGFSSPTDALPSDSIGIASEGVAALGNEGASGLPAAASTAANTTPTTTNNTATTAGAGSELSLPLSIPDALRYVLGKTGAKLELDDSFVEYLSGSCEELLRASYAPESDLDEAEHEDEDEETWLKRRNEARAASLNELLYSMIPACGFAGSEEECLEFSFRIIALTRTKEQEASGMRRQQARKKPVTIASMEKFQVDKAALEKMWGKSQYSAMTNREISPEELGLDAARQKAADRKKAEKAAKLAAMIAADEHDAEIEALTEYNNIMGREAAPPSGYGGDIQVNNFTMRYVGKELLTDTDFCLTAGRRYGLIGKNGIGKTTLLRHVIGRAIPGLPHELRICHVKQEVAADDRTCMQTVLDSDTHLKYLLDRKAELEAQEEDDNEELVDIYAKINAKGDHPESRAAKILKGLQFSETMVHAPTSSLSGGWRVRVALAAALFLQPDLLLLDEPTNHLDMQAVLWLEHYLTNNLDGTLILVSHDRAFLNDVVTDIIHMADQKLRYYRGNYDGFEKILEEHTKQAIKRYEANKKRRDEVQAFIDKFRYNAKRASLVQSRIKELARMEELDAVEVDALFRFSLPQPEPIGIPVLQIKDVGFSYSGQKLDFLFSDVNIGIDMDTRMALLGVNGAGKSTLLNIIMGKLEETAGVVVRNPKLRVGHFSQHHVELLEAGLSPLEVMMKLFPGTGRGPDGADMQAQDYRNYLGRFGVRGDLALQRISTLSGGQKSRVAFAAMAWKHPHLLILDEPTNHLDIETIEALTDALAAYKGGLIVVSHDQYFVQRTCRELWVLEDKKVFRFDGDFPAYKKAYAARFEE